MAFKLLMQLNRGNSVVFENVVVDDDSSACCAFTNIINNVVGIAVIVGGVVGKVKVIGSSS